MSQIQYCTLSPTHGPIDVTTGWDRARGCFHVTVWRVGRDPIDRPLLSDHALTPSRDLTSFIAALQSFDIPVPLQVSYLLLKHAVINAGNEIVRIVPQETKREPNA